MFDMWQNGVAPELAALGIIWTVDHDVRQHAVLRGVAALRAYLALEFHPGSIFLTSLETAGLND